MLRFTLKICILLSLPHFLWSYDWPLKMFTSQHGINATLGEMRDSTGIPDHFHSGVDVKGNQGDSIFAVDSGIIWDKSPSGLWVNDFQYYHITSPHSNGDTINIHDFVGTINYPLAPHLHFREKSNTSPPYNALNPLRSGALTPYDDSTNPFVDSIRFYRQADTTQLTGILDGKVDVLSVAGDTRTDSTGHSAGGNCSVYRIGYEVRDTLGNLFKPLWEKIKFDTIPDPTNTSQLNLTYGSGSTSSHFRFWVSNDPFNPDSTLRNWYWNTKQKIGQPDSVDADSIEVAKFTDGFYWVKVIASDIRNNADTESVKVHVDNFNPKVKKTDPESLFAFVPTKKHKVWCIFSEQMDTATLTTANIKIQSLKADSFNYPITITYLKDSLKLYLTVDSFQFKDTVQVRLLKGVRDLAGKSIQGSKQDTVAYSWTFVVGVMQLTDNNINDIQPDVYHGKIVWTQALAGVYRGKIMLYDFYQDTSFQISPDSDEHHSPYIYKNRVAWRQFSSAVTNPVYYYDGTSVTQIAPGDKGRYSMEIDSAGIAWRAFFGNYYPDTIWIEYYNFASGQVVALDTFIETEGRMKGSVDIEGSNVVWDCWEGLVKQHDIRMFDGILRRDISPDTFDDYTPKVSYGQVVFIRRLLGGLTCVLLYDGSNLRVISKDTSVYGHMNPMIENGQCAWREGDLASRNYLHYFDGRQDTKIDSGLPRQNCLYFGYYVLHNEQIGWTRLRKTVTPWRSIDNAALFDRQNVLKLTDDTTKTTGRIEVHDGFVVFDAYDGNDYEIYLYIADTIFSPPAIVKNLRGVRVGKNPEINLLSWSPNREPDIRGYKIYRSNKPWIYDTIPYATVFHPETTHADASPLLRNYYVAKAFDQVGNEGGFSNQVALVWPDTIPPLPPESLKMAVDSINYLVNLTWRTSPSPDVKQYKIYRLGTLRDSVSATTTSYVDSLVLLGKEYRYYLTAVDTTGNEGGYSNEVVGKIPVRFFTTDSMATAFGRKLTRRANGQIDLVYSASGVCYSNTTDEGVTWTRPKKLGDGNFPSLALDSLQNPCVVFGKWTKSPSGYCVSRLYYTRFDGVRWSPPYELFRSDSMLSYTDFVPISDAAIKRPGDTMFVAWKCLTKPLVYAILCGRFYARTNTPLFRYDSLSVYRAEKSPSVSCVVDHLGRPHVVFDEAPGQGEIFHRFRQDGGWSPPVNVSQTHYFSSFPSLDFTDTTCHLVFSDVAFVGDSQWVFNRIKPGSSPWDTLRKVYGPFRFTTNAAPVILKGWYTVFAETNDIFYSRFNGVYWDTARPVRITPEKSCYPAAIHHQSSSDSFLFICWREGNNSPYWIEFSKHIVPMAPKLYADCGESIPSPYCLRRKGYLKFGIEPYKTVDYDNRYLRYAFKLDPNKDYRIDLSCYFEFPKGEFGDIEDNETEQLQDIDISKDSTYTLVQLLKIDGVPLDLSYVKSGELKRVSVLIPSSLYADGEIIVDIDKVKRRYVVCGEIGLYEFDREKKREIASGAQEGDAINMPYKLFFAPVYPNPSKGIIKIRYGIDRPTKIKISLYDVSGRLIERIKDKAETAGLYEVVWNAKELPQGVYFIRFETKKKMITRKLVLVR